MNYDSVRKKCATSETCSAPTTTNNQWHAYEFSPAPPAAPAAATTAKWEPFAELKIKCERPADEAPETVTGLEACKEKAETLGRSFLNFDAEKNLCFTSLTCNNQKETVNKWQVYKLNGPAPSAVALSWEKFPEPKMKCEKAAGEAKRKVDDLAACQHLAESEGVPYFNFEPNRLECFLSTSCLSPTATSLDWQIYKRAPQWAAILEPMTKCEKPAGESPQDVADLAACQERAEEKGRKFMNFEKGRLLCYTSITCDHPVKSAVYDWQAYELDV